MKPDPQELPPGYDSQAATSGITEHPESVQVIEFISDTQSHSNGEGYHQLVTIHQVSHSKSVQNPIEVKLNAETPDSPSGEEHGTPSQSSRLIP